MFSRVKPHVYLPLLQLHLPPSLLFLACATHQRPIQTSQPTKSNKYNSFSHISKFGKLCFPCLMPIHQPCPSSPSFSSSTSSPSLFPSPHPPKVIQHSPLSLSLCGSLSRILFMQFVYGIFFSGFLIDCGATVKSTIQGRTWLPDTGFVSSGTPKNVSTPGLVPFLSTVRSFPFRNNLHKKFCYVVPVYRNAKYLVRTTYFYGGINGPDSPPVFDQIIDGTFWSVVNTTEDYANGMSSYYEGFFLAEGKTMSLCIGVNTYTDSDPFISALEFLIVGDSLYNSTDFGNFGLRSVARHAFGYSGPIIRYVTLLFHFHTLTSRLYAFRLC